MFNDATFLYSPYSDEATLSGGAWESGDVALSNVQNSKYWQVARSQSASPADTQIKVALVSPREINGFAIILPNVTPLVRVRVSAYPSDAFNVPDYTSGWVDGTDSSRWKDDERAPIVSFTIPAVTSQFWLVEIDDGANLSRHIDVARLFLAGSMSPSFNYTYDGNGLNFRDNSLKSSTLSGDSFFWRRVNPREWQCSFRMIPQTEMYADAYEFMRYVGFDREIFVIPSTKSIGFEQERRFFARMTQPNALTQSSFKLGSFGFTAAEIVARRGDSGPPQKIARARLNARGTLGAAYSSLSLRSARLSAAARVRASYDETAYRDARLASAGKLSVSGGRVASRSANFYAAGTLSVSGGQVVDRTAFMQAESTLSVSATKITYRGAVIAGASGIVANYVVSRAASAHFVAMGTLLIAGDQQMQAHFVATGGLSVAPRRSIVSSVSFEASGALSAVWAKMQTASAHLDGTSYLTVNSRKTIRRSAVIMASGTISATVGRGFDSGFDSGFR